MEDRDCAGGRMSDGSLCQKVGGKLSEGEAETRKDEKQDGGWKGKRNVAKAMLMDKKKGISNWKRLF